MFFNHPQQRPINTYPLWRYLLILAVIVIALLYATPNLFGEDPALQISGNKGTEITEATLAELDTALQEANIEPLAMDLEDGQAVIRFADTNSQLLGQSVANRVLNQDRQNYVVAQNLAPATPDWLSGLGGKPMKLGLDLRGGVHFLMEVDMNEAIGTQVNSYIDDFKARLREERISYAAITPDSDNGIQARFRTDELRDQALDYLVSNFREFQFRDLDSGGQYLIRVRFTEPKLQEIRDYAVQQNIATLRNRVNELGVAEPLIQRQGAEYIVVDLPGVQDSTTAKEILGATATLEFRIVNPNANVQDALRGRVPSNSVLMESREGEPLVVYKRVALTGEHVTDAYSDIDQQTSMPIVSVRLDGQGGSKMNRLTGDNVGNRMAMILKETKAVYKVEDGERVRTDKTRTEWDLVSAPNIQGQFGSRFQISGNFTSKETRDLSLILRSGSLIAPVYFVEERTVGPSLGQENIDQGFKSVIIGFALVLVFMAVYYRVFGLIANMALTLNLVLVVALMSIIGATLTLPGIAGIVLTVGMAVDANVLIFERIREELRDGVRPAQAIHNGYDRALSTIADANITTLVAAVILFAIGTGPVKGFAVTLMLGILTSMFTAILGTRSVVNLIYGGKSVKKLAI